MRSGCLRLEHQRPGAESFLGLAQARLCHAEQLSDLSVRHAGGSRLLYKTTTLLEQLVRAGDLFSDLGDLPADDLNVLVRHRTMLRNQDAQLGDRAGVAAKWIS